MRRGLCKALFFSLLCFRSPLGPPENVVPCSWLPNGVPHCTERVRSAGAGGVPGLPPGVLLLLQGGMAPAAPMPGNPNYSSTNWARVRGEPTEAAWSFGSFWHRVLALCLILVSWTGFLLTSPVHLWEFPSLLVFPKYNSSLNISLNDTFFFKYLLLILIGYLPNLWCHWQFWQVKPFRASNLPKGFVCLLELWFVPIQKIQYSNTPGSKLCLYYD